MSNTYFSSFLECSYSVSPNVWFLFILKLNVTLSKWFYLTLVSKLLHLFRTSTSPHGVFGQIEKSNPSSRLLILSENHLNLPIDLNKTLYCHLPEKFCNNYTNLQCPWHEWCLLGLYCVKPTWLYITFLQPFIQFVSFTVFTTLWNYYLCLIPP